MALKSTVKLVDSGAFYVVCDGPGISLHTVNKLASRATVKTIARASLHAADYIIIPTPTITYYAWMDTTGSVADPEPDGFETDSAIRVNLASASTAAQVATALAAAIDNVTGLSATVADSIYVEIDVDTTGACDPISDFSCCFTLSAVLAGFDANELVKSGVPNDDMDIVQIEYITYVSSTDVLTVLAKKKAVTALNDLYPGMAGSGFSTVYSFQNIVVADWVLG